MAFKILPGQASKEAHPVCLGKKERGIGSVGGMWYVVFNMQQGFAVNCVSSSDSEKRAKRPR